MKHYELVPCSSDLEVARRAAVEWLAQLPVAGSKPYLVALSGGRIARHFFTAIAEQAQDRNLSHVHWFWADERCVPPDHPESNFLLAQKNLFEPLCIPQSQIHRIRGEEMPARGAEIAAEELRSLAQLSAGRIPKLNMVFLGMGEDGHVASLFPGAPQEPPGSVYYSVVAAKPPPHRITVSYAVLAESAAIWVLASGRGKEAALTQSLMENGTVPLAKVIGSRQETRLFTDISSGMS